MQVPYERSGRTRQKERTRTAILTAVRELLAEGVTPTVEQAADGAEVSRTTAYRYFPNRRALLVAAVPELTVDSLLPDPAPEDPYQRFGTVVDALLDRTLEHEPELRAQLRLSLDPDDDAVEEMPFRTGRGIGWIEEAVAPLRARVGEAELHRLVLATRAVAGIDALVWLTDVAGLSREEAAELMRWSAHALYRATEQGP